MRIKKVPLGLKYLFKLPFKIFKEMEMSMITYTAQQQRKPPHSHNPVIKFKV